jgi:hypothetical protein
METQLSTAVAARREHHDLAIYFLRRLERLARLEADSGLPFDGEHLLRHAIYATYLDVRGLGYDEPARLLLGRGSR